MDIRNSLDGLKSLLGVASPAPAAPQPAKSGGATGVNIFGSDQATFSSAANEVALTANGDGVRLDKVASIQAALAAGTYHVPASAVASKVVDAMLGADR